MRVDGLIFADERLIEQIKHDQAPEQVANVAFLPGHPACQPGHARHPLGLRLLHRRRLRDRSGRRRRDLARRRRLRHQLRRAADALEPDATTTSSRGCSRWSRSSSARCRPAWAEAGSTASSAQGTAPADGRRAELSARPRLGRRRATSTTPKPAAGSTAPSPTSSAIAPWTAAPTSAARSARATISWKCRSSMQSSTRRPRGAMGLEKDMVCVMIHSRLARAGLPGLRRRPARAARRAGEVRHRAARPAARLRAGRQPRGRSSTSARCGRRRTSPGATGSC